MYVSTEVGTRDCEKMWGIVYGVDLKITYKLLTNDKWRRLTRSRVVWSLTASTNKVPKGRRLVPLHFYATVHAWYDTFHRMFINVVFQDVVFHIRRIGDRLDSLASVLVRRWLCVLFFELIPSHEVVAAPAQSITTELL